MIQASSKAVETSAPESMHWQAILQRSRMTTIELLQRLELDAHPLADPSAEGLFPLRVPEPYLNKIRKADPHDPLLLQILPQALEHSNPSGFTTDPLQESRFTPVPGIIHKYRNRVLLIINQSCAIHCRYCFRRSFPYAEHRHSRASWSEALDYVRADAAIDEVILSGGDPLTLRDDGLFELLRQIEAIPHVRRLRLHSRMPITLPQRIDASFLRGLSSLNKPLVCVVHCNHAQELATDVGEAVQRLRQVGCQILNQAVLLKGVNDSVETLRQLSLQLFDIGILPYYLFCLDRVSGAAHFEVELAQAKALYTDLQKVLPGYLVPRLALEQPGAAHKTLLSAGG